MMPVRCARNKQAGVSLIESMVALVVLALGVMGLAMVQTRMMVETRTANYRATAIGLIDDLSNRILLNRDAAFAGNYALAWGAATAAQNCTTAVCTGAQLAQSDLHVWRTSLVAALPSGDARIFRSGNDPRQIGIMVSWAANESSANTNVYTSADATIYNQPFAVANALAFEAPTTVSCPAGSICHVVYVQP